MSIYHGHVHHVHVHYVHHVHVYHVQKDGAEEEGIFFAYGYGGREQKEVLAHLKSDKKNLFHFNVFLNFNLLNGSAFAIFCGLKIIKRKWN